jgi:hypothetical protein
LAEPCQSENFGAHEHELEKQNALMELAPTFDHKANQLLPPMACGGSPLNTHYPDISPEHLELLRQMIRDHLGSVTVWA